MTPDKVIRYINAYIAVNKELDEDEKTAFKTAFEALEKQIPKKPKEILSSFNDNLYILYCPICGMNVGYGNKRIGTRVKLYDKHKYCGVCGQAINFGEED